MWLLCAASMVMEKSFMLKARLLLILVIYVLIRPWLVLFVMILQRNRCRYIWMTCSPASDYSEMLTSTSKAGLFCSVGTVLAALPSWSHHWLIRMLAECESIAVFYHVWWGCCMYCACNLLSATCHDVINIMLAWDVTGNTGSGAVRGRHCPEPSSPTRTAATLPGKLFSPVFQYCSNHISK